MNKYKFAEVTVVFRNYAVETYIVAIGLKIEDIPEDIDEEIFYYFENYEELLSALTWSFENSNEDFFIDTINNVYEDL